MRVIVLGAGGMLARDLIARAPRGVELHARTHAEVDVTKDAEVIAALTETRPDVVVNCAGYTNVDAAEGRPAEAMAVNASAPGIIGRAAVAVRPHGGALVVHFSSDYVFSGESSRPYREDDATGPLSVYGSSKLAGEASLARTESRYVVVRTSWLFGLHGRSFPRTMWDRAKRGLATRVVNDQTGCPTYTCDLADAVWQMVGVANDRSHGRMTLHVANAGQASWYDFARPVFEAARSAHLLSPCDSSEYPTAARRPPHSVLDTTEFERFSGMVLPPWEDALGRFLAGLAHG